MRKCSASIVVAFLLATNADTTAAQASENQVKKPAFPEASKQRQLIDRTALLNANAQNKRDGSVMLFNGKNLDGWTFVLDDKKAKMEDVWAVRDGGILYCQGKPRG